MAEIDETSVAVDRVRFDAIAGKARESLPERGAAFVLFASAEGVPSMRRSPFGVWFPGIPSAEELDEVFMLVTDAKERTMLINEARIAASSLTEKPARAGPAS